MWVGHDSGVLQCTISEWEPFPGMTSVMWQCVSDSVTSTRKPSLIQGSESSHLSLFWVGHHFVLLLSTPSCAKRVRLQEGPQFSTPPYFQAFCQFTLQTPPTLTLSWPCDFPWPIGCQQTLTFSWVPKSLWTAGAALALATIPWHENMSEQALQGRQSMWSEWPSSSWLRLP